MTVNPSQTLARTRRFVRLVAMVAIVAGCAPELSGSPSAAAVAGTPAAATAGGGLTSPGGSPDLGVGAPSLESPAANASPAAAAATPTPEPTTPPKPAVAKPASYAVGHLAISLSRAPGTFSAPILVTNAHDGSGRLFVVEQGGRIKIISGSTVLATPFLDIHTRVSCCGEQGLLGLAFHPSYKTNGRFFVDYTNTNGDTVIAEYRRSSKNRASTAQTILLTIAQPYANHNGGMLAFGKDGYLYIAMGDGGSGGDPENRAQNKNSLLGKILRIDVNHSSGSLHYRSPSTNPFVGKAGDDRIWAYGLRNPWRFSFDRANGDLWIGDVGQDRYEEIDRATHASGGGRGRNFGWRVLEGRACYNPSSGCSTSGKTAPLAVYNHASGCAVIGGYVYRGTAYPAMANAYLFGDSCSGRIWAVVASGASSQSPHLLLDTALSISSFGEAENGTLYLTDLSGGRVYRIVGRRK